MQQFLTGQGDGCQYCCVNPRFWSDPDFFEDNFPPPCDRNLDLHKVKAFSLIDNLEPRQTDSNRVYNSLRYMQNERVETRQ